MLIMASADLKTIAGSWQRPPQPALAWMFWSLRNSVALTPRSGLSLGSMGLPNEIVEAVAWNHRPLDSPVTEFSTLAAVHVANAIDAQQHPSAGIWMRISTTRFSVGWARQPAGMLDATVHRASFGSIGLVIEVISACACLRWMGAIPGESPRPLPDNRPPGFDWIRGYRHCNGCSE